MAPAAGTHLGPYEILEPLGAGGMGEVYRARDPRLGREVAIKVLPDEVADDPDLLHRLEKEARAAGALNHPNILVVYDVGTHEDTPYVVTELLEGDTLRERMGDAAVPLRKATDYAVQIARGLAAAHAKGIVHRDIKPENLFITNDGLVKILDFGLAKVLQPRLPFKEGEDTPSRGPTTEAGRILGTVDYMSPEQARARTVNHLSDLFSFGTVLYEMLSGHHPFRGETVADTMTRILTGDPPEPSARDRKIPKALDRIVIRCLEKQPEDRFQSARDLAFDLEAAAEATRAPRGRHRWTLAGAAAVAVLALAVAYLRPWREPQAPPQGHPALPEGARARQRLVVLPFENLGPPEDAYFAAGITEEITSRLARVSGLGVTSRTTATQYDRAGKTLQEIGEDLQVGFVLEGTVRWDRAEGAGRVRVTPQLIRVADDTHLWAQSYDRALDDVFAIQSGIAEAVVQQLGVALLPEERRAVEARPTENLEAYQAYLRGRDHYSDPDLSIESTGLAIQMLERAVELDPGFVEAWAVLAQVHGDMVIAGLDPSPERLAMGRNAAERALRLDPDSPEAHRALAYLYYSERRYEEALEEFAEAARTLPNDAVTSHGMALTLRRQGRFAEAIAQFERTRELDPQHVWSAMMLGQVYRLLRRFEEADRQFDLSIAIAPDSNLPYRYKAASLVSWNGSLAQARDVLARMPPGSYDATSWALDRYERRYQAALESLTAEPEPGSPLPLGERRLLEGELYQLTDQPEHARVSFEAARVVFEGMRDRAPGSFIPHQHLSVALAGLGRKAEAIQVARRCGELLPVSRDAEAGPRCLEVLARVYTMTGEYDAAIGELENLLSIPSWISTWDLRLDPRWDPLRRHPRFGRLVGADRPG